MHAFQKLMPTERIHQEYIPDLTSVPQLVGRHPTKQKSLLFDSHLGHMPKLQVLSPDRVRARGS